MNPFEEKLSESFLTGALPADVVPELLQRLRDMCDENSETDVLIKESVFRNSKFTHKTFSTAADVNELRVIINEKSPFPVYYLKYQGIPEIKNEVNIRQIIRAQTTEGVSQFVLRMGYEYQYEYYKEGHQFLFTHLQNSIPSIPVSTSVIILLTQIKKLSEVSSTSNRVLEPLDPYWLIEITGYSTTENESQYIANIIRSVTIHTSPYVDTNPYPFNKVLSPPKKDEPVAAGRGAGKVTAKKAATKKTGTTTKPKRPRKTADKDKEGAEKKKKPKTKRKKKAAA